MAKREIREKAQNFRIPSIIHLPFGYRINVYQTTVKNMRKVSGTPSDAEPPTAYHIHQGWTSQIWLLRHRKPIEKLDDFFHELVHAINDYYAWIIYQYKESKK